MLTRLMKHIPEDLKEIFAVAFILLVVAWLGILTVFTAMQLPWPTTDKAHMQQCIKSGGLYKKDFVHEGNWYCKGGK